jgi:hypothetical protein
MALVFTRRWLGQRGWHPLAAQNGERAENLGIAGSEQRKDSAEIAGVFQQQFSWRDGLQDFVRTVTAITCDRCSGVGESFWEALGPSTSRRSRLANRSESSVPGCGFWSGRDQPCLPNLPGPLTNPTFGIAGRRREVAL